MLLYVGLNDVLYTVREARLALTCVASIVSYTVALLVEIVCCSSYAGHLPAVGYIIAGRKGLSFEKTYAYKYLFEKATRVLRRISKPARHSAW